MNTTDMAGEDYKSPRKLWELRLRDAWQFGGSLTADVKAFAACDPRKFMTARERKVFDRLPREFTVYRGFQGGNRHGCSWSLSREAAEMFTTLKPELPKGRGIVRQVKKIESVRVHRQFRARNYHLADTALTPQQ